MKPHRYGKCDDGDAHDDEMQNLMTNIGGGLLVNLENEMTR